MPRGVMSEAKPAVSRRATEAVSDSFWAAQTGGYRAG